ncbi:SDR family oxidoreductase [Larkinella knui]|uniref:SDR family oxidoreductase n=1 Tax=Larkinella knui TaxID=2025310 RepID=A0A3P1CNA1_9BACT|nr:SDR family oxidoreductase [Larkinella knui]RRB14811.1 SDR family oxidoreductase [Larkinella knui]
MSVSNNNRTWLWGLAGLGVALTVRTLFNQWREIDFQGKTVVITGGSRGLGLVLAREFAQEGANLAICARDEDELERAKADLELNGGRVFTYACDMTDKEQVTAFIQAVQQEIGPVDVLVNNAGTILVTPIEHATEADFREVMEINFWAAFHSIQAVLPQMRERKAGRIVNIASFGGKVSFPHLLPYSTSKFALVGYSEGLRTELLKAGIYVTTVCPGLMRTGSPRNAFFKGQNEKEYAWFKIGDSLPILSKSAVESARQILEACRYGRAELIISLPAKVAAAVHGFAPGLTAEVLSVINTLLPGPGGIGEQRALGKDSETSATRSVFTTWTDDAAEANNQYTW